MEKKIIQAIYRKDCFLSKSQIHRNVTDSLVKTVFFVCRVKNHSTESGKILQDKFFISRWRRSGGYGDRRQRENKKFRRKIAESLFQTRFSKLILERVIDIERMNSYKK